MSLADGIVNASFTPGLRVTAAEFRRSLYLTNGWDRMRRWVGNWARRRDWSGTNELQEVPYAGIEGPSIEPTAWAPTSGGGYAVAGGGSWEAGTRQVRFRYGESATGHVSNPSNPISITLAEGGKTITFDVGSGSATKIPLSTDLKVDQVIIESTIADGTLFFLVGIFPTTTYVDAPGGTPITSIETSISDAALEASALPWEDDGHDLPPAKRYVLSHRGRLVLYGDVTYEEGTITLVLNSTTVVGSGTKWSEFALGTADDPPIAGRRFLRAGYFEWYEIESRDSDTQLTLKDYWGAASVAGAAYQIASGNNLIYFSRADYPEAFPPTSYIGLPTGGHGGQVTAAIGIDDAILFCTDTASFRFTWISEPSEDGAAYPVPGNRGAISPHVCVTANGRVYLMDRLGIWCYDGGVPVDISRKIEKILASLDYAYADSWHAVYMPRLKAIRWYVTPAGQTQPTYYVQYDPTRDTWCDGELQHALTASHFGRTHRDDQLRALGGDANGHVWWLDTGTSDGGAGYTHLTVAAGSFGTYVAVAETLAPQSIQLYGTEVYHPASGESRRITGNVDNALVLASAFTSIAPGDALWLGPIRAKLRTKTFYAANLEHKQRPRCLRGFYTPLSSNRYLQVRVYENNSTTAKTWGDMSFRGLMGNVIRPGTLTGYPTSDWLVNLNANEGRFEIPLGANAVWCVAVELEIVEPDAELALWGLELQGVEAPSPE